MKKLGGFLVTLMLILGLLSVASLAETKMDLSSMSLEELVALHEQVAVEMDNRGGPSATRFAIPISKYVCGKDIKAGHYTISNIGEGDVILRMSDKDNSNGTNAILKTGESIILDLSETWVLQICTGLAMIEEAKMPFAP